MENELKYSYLRCDWLHENDDYPVMLYSELNQDRFETRKLEYFRDGTVGLADDERSTKDTRLGTEPVPSIAEINLAPEFHASTTTKDDFEEHWVAAQ